MKLEQMRWTSEKGWDIVKQEIESLENVQLVIVFGHPDLIVVPERFDELKKRYPNAYIAGGSTAGNILNVSLTDQDIVATAVELEKGSIKVLSSEINDPSELQKVVSERVGQLRAPDLKHVFVLSDGIHFNGSELVKGLNGLEDISITGGLMADQGRFKQTFVMANGPAREKQIVLIGFYGESLKVGYGCFAGWDEFGVDRTITKSRGNVVYAIDGQPALALYKKYLGEFAEQLPASGLRFPLRIKRDDEDMPIIRTLLAIDDKAQSLTFAGDVPEGATVLLMKGNIENLILSAAEAAKQAKVSDGHRGLAVIISCVGRKLLMDQMTDEEIEVVQKTLGENIWLTGFYSNGELAPFHQESKKCHLHNQTMTLMTIYED